MAAVMRSNDQQSGRHGVAKQPDEGIAEANAVQVQVLGLVNQGPEFVMGGDKGPKDLCSALVRPRYALFRRFQLPARRRFHLADEPRSKPARLNRPAWLWRIFTGPAD